MIGLAVITILESLVLIEVFLRLAVALALSGLAFQVAPLEALHQGLRRSILLDTRLQLNSGR